MAPFRIAFISDYFPPHLGGMETWTYEVARTLARKGHSVVVYTPKISGHYGDEVVDGVQVRRFGPSFLFSSSSRFVSYPYLARFLGLSIWLPIRLIGERRFDATIVTYVSLSFVGVLLRLLRIPTWGIIHGFYEASEAVESHGLLRGLLRVAIQSMSLKMPVEGYIVVGNSVRAALIKRGVNQSRINVIRGGVDIDEINSVHVEKSALPQICFVSRMIPERRLDELLRAFTLVLNRVPQARLVVVGDGPLRKQWEELARSLKIERNVEFRGALYGKAKFEVLKESHILAHPSTREGMSLAIYEALACSTPVVTYDIPEIREQLALGGGGLLVVPHDIDRFAEAIVNLLTSPQLWTELSEQGRLAIENGLDWGSVAALLIDCFKQRCS